ncbi:unnamed protein product [Paramecium pentaurelia]|uniref:Uncharacterized protein n=1 Tax=Paramecium pentaurelia TaxID=43138 RepID=A0A8S1UPX8_9CILI|nr:unnamed protein product [Paramecium pentaurelia]
MDSTQYASPPYHYRWLNGNEYEDLLMNGKDHTIPMFDEHPEDIYYEPKNGYLYFLRKASLRNLGFPRLKDNSKKVFKWKKMNFQTPLPKHCPKVSYIVCSTTTCLDVPHYRMHIVQLFNQRDEEGVLLCHVLQICNRLSPIQQIKDNPPMSFEEYEEIRNCKKRLSDCMEKSMDIILEVQDLQMRTALLDDDNNYIQQKLQSKEQRLENMKLYGDMLKKYERYINAVMEGYEVIRRYDDL